LKNPHPDVFKPSNKTVDMFIKNAKEEKIKNFFLKDIDSLLSKYEPGLPKMKPDVLKQIKEIDAQRSKMMEEQNRNAPIMLQQPGKEPVALSSQEVIGIIEQQQRQLQEMGEHIQRLEMNKQAAWPPQSPFTQPMSQQRPFTQPMPPQNQFVMPNQPSQNKEADIEMAEQRIAELEKQNIELNTKFSQTFNELQKYKRLSETQKISINNLQTEKTELLLNQKKHVTFMNEK
jgi:hypothetical protein